MEHYDVFDPWSNFCGIFCEQHVVFFPVEPHFYQSGLFPAVPEDVTLILWTAGRKGKAGNFVQSGREGGGGTILLGKKVGQSADENVPQSEELLLPALFSFRFNPTRQFVKDESCAIAKTVTQLPPEQAGGDHAEQVHPVRAAVPPGHHQPAQDEYRRGEQ